jgi:hypothetical protein
MRLDGPFEKLTPREICNDYGKPLKLRDIPAEDRLLPDSRRDTNSTQYGKYDELNAAVEL